MEKNIHKGLVHCILSPSLCDGTAPGDAGVEKSKLTLTCVLSSTVRAERSPSANRHLHASS